MEKRVYEVSSADQGKLKKILEADPYAETSFSRQGYVLKEGKGVGGEEGKYYLQLKGEEDFFKWAEEQCKEVESFKRCEKEAGQKIIEKIDEESGAAEAGVGAIFG